VWVSEKSEDADNNNNRIFDGIRDESVSRFLLESAFFLSCKLTRDSSQMTRSKNSYQVFVVPGVSRLQVFIYWFYPLAGWGS
jgi:hypothetical protein